MVFLNYLEAWQECVVVELILLPIQLPPQPLQPEQPPPQPPFFAASFFSLIILKMIKETIASNINETKTVPIKSPAIVAYAEIFKTGCIRATRSCKLSIILHIYLFLR